MTTSAPTLTASSLASLPPSARRAFLNSLTRAELDALAYDWRVWARPAQLAPAWAWTVWLILAGRGFGKSRSGAEQVRAWATAGVKRMALVGKDPSDARDVMIEGESGILAISPPWFRPNYEPSKKRLTWPNGARAYVYSGAEPEGLRGPQFEKAWCDEIAAWKYPSESWDNLQFGMRLGETPQTVVTTTPKPIQLVRDLIAAPSTAVTRGSTYDNRANLPDAFYAQVIAKYEGTRLGRQELLAEMIDDVPGALWRRALIDAARVSMLPERIGRCVIGVDPAVTSSDEANETGIIAACRGVGHLADHCYVIGDDSGRYPASEWGQQVVQSYRRHRADRVVPEKNNGGDLVAHTIRVVDRTVPIKPVWASKGKRTRAEPVAALYEQGKVHHVGSFAALEDQMCTFVPDESESPDRVDALVWAISDLMFQPKFMQT